MNKAQLVDALAKTQKITKTQAGENVNAFLAAVSGELASGKTVQLIGFGSFNIVGTKARKGRNPRTGEVLKIAASKKVRFNVSTQLRANVNAKKSAPKAATKAAPKAAPKAAKKTK